MLKRKNKFGHRQPSIFKGAKMKVYCYSFGKLNYEFESNASAAKFYNVNVSTMMRYLKNQMKSVPTWLPTGITLSQKIFNS